LEVFLNTRGVSLHGLSTRLPRSRADNTRVLIGIVVTLEETNNFFNRATDLIIIDLNGANNTLRIDDEDTTESGTIHTIFGVLNEDTIFLRDLLGEIRDEGHLKGSETTILGRTRGPGEVRVDGVSGDTDNIDREIEGFLKEAVEGENFSGADEGEVEGVEEENSPTTTDDIGKREGTHSTIGDTGTREEGSLLARENVS
jgi:hypothetical protein